MKPSGKSVEEILWPHVVKTASCWLWSKDISHYGYGVLYVNRRQLRVHRVAYELTKGPIPEGLEIDHLCRVRACCNPEHLEAVTPRENQLRSNGAAGRNARKTACPRGHPYTSIMRSGKAVRYCKTCAHTSFAAWRAKKTARPEVT